MEERGLRVAKTDKAFFSRIQTTISKLLIPTKIGINGMLITIKRNNLLKNYELATNNEEQEKDEMLQKKYEDAFILYLESIDKYVMDSIYKKVRSKTATPFEEDALSRYYAVIHLKETQYLEYKYRKQKYLLDLDYMTLRNENKTKQISKYNSFYVSKMNGIYKGILKNYSIQLADKIADKSSEKENIYSNIFETLEDYISNILPIKINIEGKENYTDILEDTEKIEDFLAGKLDTRDMIEKRMYLLGVSRKLFTHSLPLVVAEQCYEKLLSDTRDLIVESKLENKKEKAYELLINLIEEYNIKLLSTKIYWEDSQDRENYKKFWDEYKKIDKVAEEAQVKKEVLFIKEELSKLENNKENKQIIRFYKDKLIEYGELKVLKNKYKTRKKIHKESCKSMREIVEITYVGIKEDTKYKQIVDKIYETCFKEENLYNGKLYVSVIISDEKYIKEINSKYRKIDKVTDVLSFPMFEKEEIDNAKENEEVLGDIIICIPQVEKQAEEYGHSIMREFAYMLVHGFYHLMGYDHMTDEDKVQMREKEEYILKKMNIKRGSK